MALAAALVGWLAMLASMLIVARWVVSSRVQRVNATLLEERLDALARNVSTDQEQHAARHVEDAVRLDAMVKRLDALEVRVREADRQLASMPARRRA